LLREFCECSGADCNPESEGFLGRVKKFWDGMTGEDQQRPN
ncbi:MAG: molecular chaperone DnaJ, partial [Pseudomonadota bacterium]|nr:molecular chaperone DnaJ [Pseudomonadota bacterium]